MSPRFTLQTVAEWGSKAITNNQGLHPVGWVVNPHGSHWRELLCHWTVGYITRYLEAMRNHSALRRNLVEIYTPQRWNTPGNHVLTDSHTHRSTDFLIQMYIQIGNSSSVTFHYAVIASSVPLHVVFKLRPEIPIQNSMVIS